jgi:hypothetical protein
LPSIHTLVPDVQHLLKEKNWKNEIFHEGLSDRLRSAFGVEESERMPTLRLSQMGDRCPRALWYSIHHPELAEPLPPWAEFKYAYGHVIEALALTLAKAAGHTVEGDQDELILNGVKGHRDAVIDGCVVDVKSTTSFTMAKAKKKIFEESDNFGYLDQLDGYVSACVSDPLVTVKDKGYLWFIDKQLGHMHVYEHKIRPDRIISRIQSYQHIVAERAPPPCECGTRALGNSGNIELDVRASYSAFKFCCFPTLRTFLYADGPKYLTRVGRLPEVPEIDRYGNIVYH